VTVREHRRRLEPAAADYRAAADHCTACAEYLEATAATDPDVRARLAAGASHYRWAAGNWRSRLALYGARDRRSRARILRRLLAARAYRPKPAGGFGRPALAKDVAAGLALRAGA
jgi:hypothetical protein